MKEAGKAYCGSCDRVFDPTVAFQKSLCCGAAVCLRRAHYACSACGVVVPSRFLFDERVFDSEYFRQAMRESRERAHERRERVRLMLLGTRSDSLTLTELPGLDSVPGFVDALTEFLGAFGNEQHREAFGRDSFRMEAYREAIRMSLLGHAIQFDAIPPLHQDARRDRIRRFITLVFMEHERELTLTQYGNQILVGAYEADIEG
jgi:hypothetical protein